MFNTPRCSVTTKDFTILENMIRRIPPHNEGLLRLLRRKLATATIVLPEDIAPQIATINSRVEYRIDDGRTECCVLVHGEEHVSRGLTLPISTLRGLALIGLATGDAVSIERPDGRIETVYLENVAYQPEGARRGGFVHPPGTPPHLHPDSRGTVVNLRQHTKSRTGPPKSNAGFEDDDHGPPAA
ncbi:MAG: nucleoside-diphosphate kinase [Proteobacteria bacterium]|nr:nucleoside-diphosphate kinase [Pseudomonadota bacterium]